ncbi:MAG: zinc-dependent alcohol dehydrogenase [Acidimicrobiales bacterium]
MRAAVLEAPGQLVVRELAVARRDDLAEVRVEQAGVCGTDRKVVDGSMPSALPRVIGHELVGRLVADAPAVEGGPSLAAGTRVLVDPSMWCGRCDTCRRGLVHLCPSGGLMGRDVDGGLAELVAVPAERLHVVPESVGMDDAALLQVLGTCVHAQRQVDVFPVDHAVVVGLGVSGLLHVQLLRARGARTVVGVGRSASKRELAEQLGATVTCTPDEAPGMVAELTGGNGAGVVVEAAGVGATVSLAVELAGFGATVVIFGTVVGGEHPLPFYDLYRKELTLVNPRAAVGRDYDDAIAVVVSGAVRGAPLVTERLPMTDAPGVLAGWYDKPGRLKVVFEP